MYMMHKELDAERTKEVLDRIFRVFMIADLKADHLKKAVVMRYKDYDFSVNSEAFSTAVDRTGSFCQLLNINF